MNIERFAYTPVDLSSELTNQSHQTIYWLNRNGYLSNEDAVDLLSRMIVVPIKNKKSFGERILNRFFDKKSTQDSYVFPITMLDKPIPNTDHSDNKPTLTVVK